MNAAKEARPRGARRTGTRATRRRWQAWVAGGAILAVAATVAVVVAGFDSRETPREDPSVWVARSSGQYARVNTETAEIDTVRLVDSPSSVVQSGGLSLLLTQGYGRAWTIDPSSPRDIQDSAGSGAADEDTADEDAAGDGAGEAAQDGEAATGSPATGDTATADSGSASGIRTPDGTRQVIAEGDRVLFHTEAGAAYLASVIAGEDGRPALGAPMPLDPLADERDADEQDAEEGDPDGADSSDAAEADGPGEQGYQVAAAALDANGLVALFSPTEQGIRWYDAARERFRGGLSAVPAEVPAQGVQLAIVAGKWVLFDEGNGLLWREDLADPVELDTTGVALLQGSSTEVAGGEIAGTDALVADEAGLWVVDRDGRAERIAEASGVPARPQQAGELAAAWIGSSGAGMWTSGAGYAPLELDETVEDLADPDPVIRTNGGRALIAEARSGMMWTVPDGRLIPVEQWTLVDPPKNQEGEVVTQDVTEQEPPVATDDAFGVRAGEPALLPVLLNDFDPNRKDVLTVVPDGLGEGLPAEFGTLAALSDGQGLTVQPSAAAQGSVSFGYRITDGVNVSEPATVTLTVVDDSVNTAPEWCPVTGCQRPWPSPELAPGGTLVLPILEGWVDPEGDPMMLADASPANPADPVRVLITADGRLAVRHTDANAPDGDIVVRVRVTDGRGEAVERELRIRVRPGAALDLAPMAVTVKTGEAQVLRPLERAIGGSGSFQLVDAIVQQGALSAVVNTGSGTIETTAAAAGSAIIAVTVRDSVTEQEATSVIRVTAVDTRGSYSVPPLRAFVRPLADTTVDVLAALPGANARALTVQSATVRDGQLRADVIEHSRIRLSGATPDGQPGRIGSVEVVIDEGGTATQARLTVFQVPATVGGAIAVADTATVRAGSVVDIPVLDNDVAPPGERLVLHPEVGAPGAEGELAFASGGRVRYLAPETPGTYTVSYTAYGASSPELSDVGHVRVTVLPTGANRPPQPATVTVRVAPGERVSTAIPLSGVDPDGDRVRLVSVGTPEDAQLSATILARTSAVQVEASQSAARGTQTVAYTVRDSFGGEAEGRLRIIVTDPDPGGGAPVVYSDYVRIARGAVDPATVRPLENDLDPSGGTLELVSVVPNVPGGEESPAYAALAARLDTSRIDQGIVRVTGGEELGTVSFKYTVRSSKSKSTADGLIVVQVSERIGLQAPAITDTVLSVRDRADFQRSGVDVVTDRVRWAGGDVGALELSLWGSAAERYSVSGSKILGSYRAEGDLVPFRLAGLDATGAEVESFGFLIVPPLDELRLTLRPGLPPISVDEDKSIDVNVADMLDLGPGDTVELDQSAFSTQRGQASCQATGTTTLRYTAGKEAPWSDSCTVRVRLAEQRSYTALALPISVVPREPVVQLNPLTRTIAPGETQTIDLVDMVGWQGGREGQVSSLQWQLAPVGGSFEVTASGSQVQVLARADAVPGAQQAASVTVTGAGSSQAVLTLRVGEAAQDAPRGATVALQCTVGSSCETPLVNRPGEHDPFAGKPGGGLHVVSVDGSACTYGSLQMAGDSVRVSWADARGPGGRCTANYTVRDAQNRTGTGTIEFDAQGVPRAPASISQLRYGADSVTLEVQLGEAANAHPSVTGVVIDMDGSRTGASCSPSGGAYECTVSGLEVGVKHSFTARAVNAVGESDPTANAATGWAYRTPSRPTATATQLSAESATQGTMRLDITTTDSTTGGFRVTAGGQTQTVAVGAPVQFAGLAVGPVAWQVVPVSKHEVPPGDTADGEVASGTFDLGGRPIVQVSASSTSPTTADIVVTVNANGGSDVKWGFNYQQGRNGTPACSATTPGTSGFGTATVSPYRWVSISGCAENNWGPAETQYTQLRLGGDPAAPQVNSGITIATAATGGEYQLVSGPMVTPVGDLQLQYQVQGVTYDLGVDPFPLWLDPNSLATAQVRQCADDACSPYAAIGSNVPATVRVDIASCIPADADANTLRLRVSAAARNFAVPSYDGTTFTVSWTGDFAPLNTLSVAVPACAPPPGPDPEPEPGGGG